MYTEEKMTVSKFLANYVSKFSVILFLGIGFYFYFIFRTFDMFPLIWNVYVLCGVLAITLLLALLCFLPKVPKTVKIVTMVFAILFSGGLGYASWYLPHIRSKIEKAFAEVPLIGEAEINFYVLKNEYKSEPTGVTTPVHLEDYKDKKFILQKSTDLENQEYAMLVANRELYSNGVQTVTSESIFDAVDALYAQTGDVMIMNASYIPMIEEITGYEDFLDRVEVVYTVYKKLQLSNEADKVDVTTKPFNVMIVGSDKWGDTVLTTGRTDVNMIASVNPITKQISFISIPRDAYVPNACLYNNYDKLTHAGVYGIKCTEETIENYLGIDINYYVVVNFSSLVKIVDALGGVNIDNPYAFTTDSTTTFKGTFEKGNIYLDGNKALAYVRERKSLENGDYARGEHQTIVIKALLEKLTEASVITRIDKLLESLNGTFATNISMEEIYALAQMQLDDMALWNINMYALTGTDGLEVVASLDAANTYSVVYLKDTQVAYVKEIIKQIMNGEILNQGNLPE
ncbi:MAG: LCP family protein [Erysipelotrichaceae bacterium]|nr:LCP family protein [Erysipelotrichaceae bacterium]